MSKIKQGTEEGLLMEKVRLGRTEWWVSKAETVKLLRRACKKRCPYELDMPTRL